MRGLLPLEIISIAQRQNCMCMCVPGCKVARHLFHLTALLALTLNPSEHTCYGEYHRMILWAPSKVNSAKQPLLEMRGACCCGRHTAQPRVLLCFWAKHCQGSAYLHFSWYWAGDPLSAFSLLPSLSSQVLLSDHGLFWVACISHFC